MNSSFSCFFGGRGDAGRPDTVLETMGSILSFTWMGLVTAWTYDGIFESRGELFSMNYSVIFRSGRGNQGFTFIVNGLVVV